MNQTIPSVMLSVFVSSVTLICCSSAQAQDALGTGNALDRNLGVGSGGINAPTVQPNFRDRNLIITGDVIGGRGFRGSVGYTAEYDFRGALGSNQLFNFRANSALSSPSLLNNTVTYEQLRFGQDLGIVEYRRAGSAAPAATFAQDPISVDDGRNRLQLDQRLRASALSSTQLENIQPRIVGTAATQDGQLLVINASTVRGLTAERPLQSLSLFGLSPFDAARIRDDIVEQGMPPRQLGSEFQTQFEFLRESKAIESATDPNRIDSRVESDHTKILQRIAERYADRKDVDLDVSPELVNELSSDYQQLRNRLTGNQSNDALSNAQKAAQEREQRATDYDRATQPADRTPGAPGVSDSERPGTPSTTPSTSPSTSPSGPGTPSTTPSGTAAAPTTPTTPTPPAADYGVLLRHGLKVEQLSESVRDRFNELVSSGESHLRAGEYITAEQRFERALRLVPGHPLATAGMANAQIGAGLYLSASLTLRELMRRQPEMIDVEYARELLPKPERLNEIITRLNEHLQGDSADRANYAFLLAYIGKQTKNRELMERGLTAMGDFDPSNRLLPLLREVWLAPPSEKSAEAAQPTPAAEPEK